MAPPATAKEDSMETTKSTSPEASDVLHFDNQSKLSPEEVAKALAHHKRHHNGDEPQSAPAKTGAGKKQK
jgi:hypothetical protein